MSLGLIACGLEEEEDEEEVDDDDEEQWTGGVECALAWLVRIPGPSAAGEQDLCVQGGRVSEASLDAFSDGPWYAGRAGTRVALA